MKYLLSIILTYLSINLLSAKKLKTNLPEKVINIEFGPEKGPLSIMYEVRQSFSAVLGLLAAVYLHHSSLGKSFQNV